ncbi:hypothetical protein HRI_001582700 [Hibiscus trionum]|uniref:3'-5' exonuclease domain-containing protein n=1 Tax=Hibiscus trionum TaxID=183268 RepID=A0A9W7HKN5_HIBTR|nr:hypothetical protein HRI_001582700 [Hibiscus trionum]
MTPRLPVFQAVQSMNPRLPIPKRPKLYINRRGHCLSPYESSISRMAAVNQLTGAVFEMVDGTALKTEVLSDTNPTRANQCLSFIYEAMMEHQDMVVGLDITWRQNDSDDALLVICTRLGCVLTTVRSARGFWNLKLFLNNKDIIFVGVRMKEDVDKLRLLLPLGFRNVVDLGELASDALHQPRLRAVGVRTLASKVLSLPFKSRSLTDAIVSWSHPFYLERNQTESATIDAYAAYLTGKELLKF